MNNEKLETFEKMKENRSMMRTSGKKLLEIVQTNEQKINFFYSFFLFFSPLKWKRTNYWTQR